MATYKLLLLPGDGIGPEVMAEVEKLIAWMNAHGMGSFATEQALVGGLSQGQEGAGQTLPPVHLNLDFATKTAGKTLTLTLKFGPNRERSIAGVRRVSKPGLRVYAKATNLPKVLGGLGVAIISTSGGLRTDRQCAKQSVGGEVLAYVW